MEMGEHLANSIYEYMLIIEEEQRQKHLREMERKKKKHMVSPSNKPKQGGKDKDKEDKRKKSMMTNKPVVNPYPVSNSRIRNIKALFQQLDKEEERRDEMMKIEEEETRLKPIRDTEETMESEDESSSSNDE